MCLPSRHRSDREVCMCVYVMILLLGHLPLRPRLLESPSPATGGNYLVMVRLSEKSHGFPRGWLCLEEHIFIQHRHTLLTHSNTAQTGCCVSTYFWHYEVKKSSRRSCLTSKDRQVQQLYLGRGIWIARGQRHKSQSFKKKKGQGRTEQKVSNVWEPNLPYWWQRPQQQTKLVFFLCVWVFKQACASFSVTYDVYIIESFVPPPQSARFILLPIR